MPRSALLLAASLILLLIGACSDRVAEHYATYGEAVRAGAVTRGFLPSFVPGSAHDIDLMLDLDTDQQWFYFKAGPEFLPSISGSMQQLSFSDVKKDRIVRPEGIRKWPAELDEILFATPRASFRYFSTCSSSGCICLAVDPGNGDVFGWTCQR